MARTAENVVTLKNHKTKLCFKSTARKKSKAAKALEAGPSGGRSGVAALLPAKACRDRSGQGKERFLSGWDRLQTIGRILMMVEETSKGRRGCLELYDERKKAVASLLVENGKVCWAQGVGCSTGLTERFLAKAKGIDRADFQRALRHCAQQDVSLPAFLVYHGVLGVEDLRDVLRHQVVSTLIQIARRPLHSRARFTPHTKPIDTASGYDPLEILTAVMGASLELHFAAGELPRTYQDTSVDLRASVCLRPTGNAEIPALPMHAQGLGEMGLTGLMALYRRSVSSTRSAGLGTAWSGPYATLVHHGGESWLVTSEERHLCAYKLGSSLSVARMLAHFLGRVMQGSGPEAGAQARLAARRIS